MNEAIADLIDRLCIANIKISILEGDIRKGKEAELGLEEVGLTKTYKWIEEQIQ